MAIDYYREYVLAELRYARRRADVVKAELDTIGTALAANKIGPETALASVRDIMGTMFNTIPSPAELKVISGGKESE